MDCLDLRERMFESIRDAPPIQFNNNDDDKYKIHFLAEKNIISDKDVKIQKMTEKEAGKFYNRMKEAEIRINFDGRFVDVILKEGYKHWSQLEKTANTTDSREFIQRIYSEYVYFDINVYNNNVLSRAEKLPIANFIKAWNEYFETDFSKEIPPSMEQIFTKTGFTEGDLPREVIFGALYHNNEVLSFCDEKNSHVEKYYGKSQIILKKECSNKVTHCFGDSFDANPEGYAWTSKKAQEVQKTDILFTLSDGPSCINRLRSLLDPESSVPYIEAHLFDRVESKHISKIILSKTEMNSVENLELLCEKLTKIYEVTIEMTD